VFLQGLLDQGYPGKIFPVNPRADFIDGLRAYPSVKEIPEDIDLAILLVPAPLVLPALEQCGEKRVKAAVIYTSGFAETGEGEGKKREEQILRVARKRGISLIGPNCMGIYDPNHRLAFFPGLPREAGKVGMISQSGSLAILFSRMAEARGIHFSKIISSGNESDLNSSDFLSFLGQDPRPRSSGLIWKGERRPRLPRSVEGGREEKAGHPLEGGTHSKGARQPLRTPDRWRGPGWPGMH
jgi:acetyltransferase